MLIAQSKKSDRRSRQFGDSVKMTMSFRKVRIAALIAVLAAALQVYGQEAQPLRLVATIPLSNVKGRLDHLYVDSKSQRLFVAGLENGSVEVVDLKQGRWTKSIPGFNKPQGIVLIREFNKLFVTSGDDGMVRVFSGDKLKLTNSIKLDLGTNRIEYDGGRKLLYIGYGGKDAGKGFGEVAVMDAKSEQVVSTIHVDAHPSELLLGESGARLFVLVPAKDEIQVIDTNLRKVVATWPVSSKRPGDAALDDRSHRLMIGTHTPASMIAMDATNGKEVAVQPTVEGMDGVYYDASRRRVYVSGGRGFDVGAVFVYQRDGGDGFSILGKIPTKAGAGTSFWSAELNRLYVAAPAHDADEAAILVFEPGDSK
jgi:DNA-binding beta-propeller fold protein YncE